MKVLIVILLTIAYSFFILLVYALCKISNISDEELKKYQEHCKNMGKDNL